MQTKLFNSNRLASIDALRGLAIFGVIVVHASEYVSGLPTIIAALALQGARGVQLFFIISAFTLCLSFSARKDAEVMPLKAYLIRRFFRIAPLFYLAVVVYLYHREFINTSWRDNVSYITAGNIISTITFSNSWNPFWINNIVPGGWSIAVEMPFYLLFPYLYKKIKSLDTAIFYTFSLLVASILFIIFLNKYYLEKSPFLSEIKLWNNYLYFFLPSQLPVFLLGFVLYYLAPVVSEAYSSNEAKIQAKRGKAAFLLLCMAFFLYIALAFGYYNFIPGHFLYGITFILLALSLLLKPFTLIVNLFWCFLGRVSYSIYLSHFAILYLVNKFITGELLISRFNLPSVVIFFVLVIATLVLSGAFSMITYYLIEIPSQVVGRNLIAKLEKKSYKIN